MSNDDKDLLTPKQRDVANDLTEWRDAGGPVEVVVLSIQRMILEDMRYVQGIGERT